MKFPENHRQCTTGDEFGGDFADYDDYILDPCREETWELYSEFSATSDTAVRTYCGLR
ncbi:MAG: hypothetical protein KDA36_08940 [Planctomycetaceae bacterium]|nr:hypothetical protein [Planctomycetaceae bacterium]